MVRVVLLPFHTTPPNIQLDGTERDEVDQQLKDAMSKPSAATELSLKSVCGRISKMILCPISEHTKLQRTWNRQQVKEQSHKVLKAVGASSNR